MSQKFQYTTVDTMLAKFNRDFRGNDINESDAIEWIGEALGFMRIPNMQEEAVAFVEVKNFQCSLPNGLHNIIQIARNMDVAPTCVSDVTSTCGCENCTIENGGPVGDCLVAMDCQGNLIGDYDVAYYRPYFDLQYEYFNWSNSRLRREKFVPVRLANHTFFNTLVCQEEDQDIYTGQCGYNGDEYTIVGDELRFSFKEGLVAISYLRQPVDPSTGYPKIPDDISVTSAINYYVGWKLMERMCWLGREGSCQLSDKAESKWLKYVNQSKNKAMMPNGVDQYQNLMEQSRYLIPRFNRYYGFFGKLGKKEQRPFNDPDHRNKYTTYLGNR